MQAKPVRVWVEIAFAVGLAIVAFAGYWLTLAPGPLWGDAARLQVAAYTGLPPSDGASSWLWLQVARLFVLVPLGTPALLVSVLSARAAAGACALVYLWARWLKIGRHGAIVATVALAVSHTFWSHAVRASEMPFFLALLIANLALWTAPNWTTRRLFFAGLLFGITLLAHPLALTLLPMIVLALLVRSRELDGTRFVTVGASLVLGLLLFAAFIYFDIAQQYGTPLLQTIADYLSTPADFSLQTVPRNGVHWLLRVALSFFGASGLLALVGIILTVRRQRLPQSETRTPRLLIITFLVTAIMAACLLGTNRAGAYLLPSFVAIALLAGYGADFLLGRLAADWRRHIGVHLIILAFLLPLVAYAGIPRIFGSRPAQLLDIGHTPQSSTDGNSLWPSLRADNRSDQFANAALDALPRGAILIADHERYHALRYQTVVNSQRPDVRLMRVDSAGTIAEAIRGNVDNRPIFIADNDPAGYQLPDGIELLRIRPIFQLIASPGS